MTTSNAPWRRTFFVIWTGQAFSILGSSAAQFAIIWWLTLQSGSPTVLALASIAGFLPQALLGPIAGVWVDRMSRKTVMVAADLFIALASLALAIAFWSGTPAVWFVYLILLLRAIGTVFHTPAFQAAMPMLVPQSELVKTGGWSQFLSSGSLMIGPVLGTALMTAFYVGGVLMIDVVGALLAALALAFVRIPDPASDPGSGRHVGREMLDGLREVVRNKPLMAASVPILLLTFVYVPVSTLFPLMVRGHFGGTAWHASVVEFLFAGGMLASSLILGVWGGLKNSFLVMNLGLAALGLLLVMAGLLPPAGIFVFAGLSGLMGVTGNFISVPYMAFLQTTVPPASLGRVFSLVGSVMSLAIPVGLFVAAPIAERVGIAAWFSVSGALIVLSALVGHLLTRDLPAAGPAESVEPG